MKKKETKYATPSGVGGKEVRSETGHHPKRPSCGCRHRGKPKGKK